MNSNSELLKRMLESFPVNLLKSYFSYDGNKNNVIGYIVDQVKEKQIEDFVSANFGHLHQRVFLREVKKGSLINTPNLMTGKLLKKTNDKNGITWIYLHKALLHYFDTKTDTKKVLNFLVPVKIKHNGSKLIISYNTFARDIRTYFDYTVFPLPSGKIEEFIFDDIKSYCSQVIFKLDLNKGIKHLWENEVIDGLNVKHRQSKSLRQDRMDESFTYKKSYPSDWKNLMLTPIQKTKFKILKNSTLSHFECNPSTGFLGVTIHPDNKDDVDQLMDLILKHNK